MDCELCGSRKHNREGCRFNRLAEILEGGDNEIEMGEELAEEMDRLWPGIWGEVKG